MNVLGDKWEEEGEKGAMKSPSRIKENCKIEETEFGKFPQSFPETRRNLEVGE